MLKARVCAVAPQVCPERARYYTSSWRQTEGRPVAIRRALAFKAILENQTVFVGPGELIAGHQAGRPVAAPIFPEYGVEWLQKELPNLSERRLDKFLTDESVLQELDDIFAYWKGKTHFDRVKAETLKALPERYLCGWDADNGILNDVLSNSGRMATGDGHVIADFEKLLRVGLSGIIAEVKAEMEKADEAATESDRASRRPFLESVLISMEAAITFAHRHAELARNMATREKDTTRRKELEQIAQVCSRVPEHPATTFWEALPSCWFVHLLLQIESNGQSMSFGRFDQYLYPYYQRDLNDNRLTREEALELVENVFVKCNEIAKIRQWSHTRKMHGYPLFQTLTIGGQTRDGTDAVNPFSYVCLEAVSRVKLQEPTVVARIHSSNPPEFMLA